MHLLSLSEVGALERTILVAVTMASATILMSRADFCQTVSGSIEVTAQQISAREPAENWLSYNGDYSGRRLTSLSQMTLENPAQLRVQWSSIPQTPIVWRSRRLWLMV
jgi:alcohol dehydrogenase (cytochrome c)